MGVMTISAHRPKPGHEAELERVMRAHVPELRKLGLATDRAWTLMRAPDGVLVEIFEWVSQEAIHKAHEHPGVLEMWKRFAACSEIVTLADCDWSKTPFPPLEAVNGVEVI